MSQNRSAKSSFRWPLIWSYLLESYFKIVLLCALALSLTLLVTRLESVAKFAVLGGGLKITLLFTGLQIPYILPFLLPISCFIASLQLFQNLSRTGELTAFRAAGISIYRLAAPLLIASLFMMLLDFTISSELTPLCRKKTTELIEGIARKSPLLLLQKDSGQYSHHIYSAVDSLEKGKRATGVFFVLQPAKTGKFITIAAEELATEDGLLIGKNVAIISSFDINNEQSFDHLLIENQKSLITQDSFFFDCANKQGPDTKMIHQSTRQLLASLPFFNTAYLQNGEAFGKNYMELLRRISLALACFSFSFLGISCGLSIGRSHSRKGLFTALATAFFFLFCFISGKSFWKTPDFLPLFYLLPHPIMWIISARLLGNIERGIER